MLSLRRSLHLLRRGHALVPAAVDLAAVNSTRAFCDKATKSDEGQIVEKDSTKLDQEGHLLRMNQLVVPYMAREELSHTDGMSAACAPGEEGRLALTTPHTDSRKVTIFRPSINVMQSATYKTRVYRLKFDTKNTWVNPLMGWTSSSDPTSQLHDLKFETKESAVRFCTRQGWAHEVAPEPNAKKDFKGLKDYSDNFLTTKIKLGVKKKGEAYFIHDQKTAHTSAWANVHRSDYSGDKYNDDRWKAYRTSIDT